MTTYCILNPKIERENICAALSPCGINIMMDNSIIYKDPNIIILLKGQIYNVKILCQELCISLETKPECVIIHLYKKYGIDYTLQVLDGVFSFILFDYYFENDVFKIYVVSDICGIIPLYSHIDEKTIVFTEHKIISEKHIENKLYPGCYSLYELGNKVSAEWNVSNIVNKPYFLLPNSINKDYEDYEIISNKLWKCLKQIVLKTIHAYHQNQDIVFFSDEDVVNGIVDNLYSSMDIEDDKQNEFFISNEKLQKEIIFSSKNFLIFYENDRKNVFENDIMTRKKIYSTVFELDKKYPFFDKSFIMLYFSIPLSIRYQDDIFLLYKSRYY